MHMKTKISVIVLLILSVFFFNGCQKNPETISSSPSELKAGAGAIRIAVLSDIHYMAPELLISDGPAFQGYLAQDPKLLKESREIFLQTITQINADKPQLLLITGDLTKDGEEISHEQVISILKQNLDPTIKVLVIPGNHDINNPDAFEYDGDNQTPVASISDVDFDVYYSDFGYGNPLSRDLTSHSYVSEPFKGLRILAIDATKPNGATCETSGVIRQSTLTWIMDQMADAQANKAQVIAIMHHLLVNHYQGQSTIDPGYVIDNSAAAENLLKLAGLKVILTGHYHATDITLCGTGTILDIETGSPVTYPLAYRMIKYQKNDKIEVETKYIRGINIGETPVEVYAESFLASHLDLIFTEKIKAFIPGDPEPHRTFVAEWGAPLLRKALMAHYAGNEQLTPEELIALRSFQSGCGIPALGDLVFNTAMAFWSDLAIQDLYVKWIFAI